MKAVSGKRNVSEVSICSWEMTGRAESADVGTR
jgi:hypothetical protein